MISHESICFYVAVGIVVVFGVVAGALLWKGAVEEITDAIIADVGLPCERNNWNRKR